MCVLFYFNLSDMFRLLFPEGCASKVATVMDAFLLQPPTSPYESEFSQSEALN